MSCLSSIPQKQVVAFLKKTYSIVSVSTGFTQDDSHKDIISWDDEGKSIRILDEKALENKILPQFFRHKNMKSFIRQVLP